MMQHTRFQLPKRRTHRLVVGTAAVVLVAAGIGAVANGFGTSGAYVNSSQRAVSASGAITLSSTNVAGDPGGTAITETVTDMYPGDYRERLVTITPSGSLTPAIGLNVNATLNSDSSTTPLASTNLAGDAENILQGSNVNITPGQPGGAPDAGQGGLYVEAYTCAGTWSSVAGAVTTATDDRDYTCSAGGNGTLLTSYDVPTSGPSPTQWAIAPISTATTILLRTRFSEDAASDGRQVVQSGEQATLTHNVSATSALLTGSSFDSNRHTCVVTPSGTLWCWGRNWRGELGVGDTTYRSTPTQVGGATTWANVSVGFLLTCATQTDGTIWCWGDNTNGQLGVGDTTQRTTPTQVGALTTWSQITAGNGHTCARKTDGTIWCWGDNSSGQLGNGTTTQSTSPVQAGAATNWAYVDVGSTVACAIKTDNTLWCWGQNYWGQLGLGDTADRASPTQVGAATDWATVSLRYESVCAVKTTGTLWCWGNNSQAQLGQGDQNLRFSPTQVGVLTTWASVGTGRGHTCARKTDATLWCWGATGNGQLGSSEPLNRSAPSLVATSWTTVAAGNEFSCGVKTAGTLWCWGANWTGQLGLGTSDQNSNPTPLQVGVATDWSKLAFGEANGCGIKTGGTLWCWGGNNNGQLGLGDTTLRNSPVQVGVATNWATIGAGQGHVCAVKTTGTLWCWGWNNSGQLGLGDNAIRTSPTQVGVLTTWATVSNGYSGSCATRTNGTLWCWGDIPTGNVTTPTQVGVVTTWATISIGHDHICATRTNGTLWCWGQNAYSQVGDGTTTYQTAPVQIGAATDWSYAAGSDSSTCGVKTTGRLFCWGRNDLGQLGLGDYVGRTMPAAIGGTKWSMVRSGQYSNHFCSIDTAAALRCWGSGSAGQTATGVNSVTPAITQVGSGTTWTSVQAGEFATCASKSDTSLWCWGLNDNYNNSLGFGNDNGSPDTFNRNRPNLVHTNGSGRTSGAA